MKKYIFLIAAMWLPFMTFAQNRSESEAITIAQEFWGNQVSRAKLKAVSQNTLAKAKARVMVKSATAPAGSKQSFYVINDEEHNRFVIVSSDDRMYTILGYSENGVFASDSIPLGLAYMLKGYDQQYNYLLNHDSEFTSSSIHEVNSEVKIDPLIKTKWGQSAPYYNDCPKFGGVLSSVTGCVATAMAQVMNYHKYPATGKGQTSYTTTTLGFKEEMSFTSCNFDWNNMADTYNEESTNEQKDAVAKLMHACGVAVHMDYTFGESGSYSQDLAYALHKYFGYNSNLKYYERKYFSEGEWNSIILNDLSNGLPIIYGGLGETTKEDGTKSRYGHQFMLDGYDGEGKYHFNWGWEGQYDGYFELTALSPNNYEFSLEQSMVCNISKQTTGRYEDIFFANELSLSASKVKVGESIIAKFDPICYSVNTNTYDSYFNGIFGIGVFDMDRKFVNALYSDTGRGQFKAGTYYVNGLTKSINFSESTFKEGGKYYIAPFAKSKNSTDYTWIRTTYGNFDYYLAEVKDGEVTLTLKGVPSTDIPELETGVLYATAFNMQNEKERWNISLTKDATEEGKYWLSNIDPSLSGTSNVVYGLLDTTGTLLTIPQGQSLGENISITNYSANEDIKCLISSTDKTLTIPYAWGALKTVNASSEKLSCYTSTEINYTPKDDVVTVDKPTVVFKEGVLQILCSTPEVKIYYTLDGTAPSDKSVKYVEPVTLDGNCKVKAIAIHQSGKKSDVVEYEVNYFKVATPTVSVTNNKVTIECTTGDAKIYYTLDGSDPKDKTNLYNGAFSINSSYILKAYGVKEKYNDSEVVEESVIFIPNGGENNSIAVYDNVAGKLCERVSVADISNKSILIITGELNGTDFLHLYKLLAEGSISDLNLAGTKIVSGGEPYYTPSILDPYYTEDDIIGSHMFSELNSLVSLVLPESVKKIDIFGIYECDNIGSLNLPQQCVELAMNAIYGCKNLNTLVVGEKLKVFNGDAIYNCNKLEVFKVNDANEYFKAIDGIIYSKDGTVLVKYPCGLSQEIFMIPSSVLKIENSACEQSLFSEVVFPNSVKTIGFSAFSHCKNLLNLELPNNVTKIGRFAFWECISLNYVLLSDNITEIPDYSFRGCSSLRELSIGKSVSAISDDAFTDCQMLQKFAVEEDNNWYCDFGGILYTKNMDRLVACPTAYYSTNLEIPEGVLAISDHAFYHCSNIEKITLPETLKEIGNAAFSNCVNLESIVMPKQMNAIGYLAFSSCVNLKTLIIPDGIQEIGMNFADGCKKLTYLSLPKTINKISTYAFARCSSLKNISCSIVDVNALIVETSVLDGTYSSFNSIPDDCTWHVPEGCASTYESQPWWVSTWKVIDDIHSGINTPSQDDIVKFHISNGFLIIESCINTTISIFDVMGTLVKKINVSSGILESVSLPVGIYIINGKKIFMK